MSDDNQNEFKGWGDKLHQLESLTGDPVFQRDEAWKKLRDRFNKKQRKPIAWYWMAAAIVILAAGLWLLDPLPSDKGIVPVTKLDKTTLDTSGHSDNVLINRMLMHEKVETASIPALPNKEYKRTITPAQHNVRLEEPLREITMAELAEQPPLAIETIQLKIDTVKIVEAPVRKLKVIHINEIDPQPTERFAGQQLRIDLTRPGLNQSTPFLSMSGNTSDNIVKLKISPSN